MNIPLLGSLRSAFSWGDEPEVDNTERINELQAVMSRGENMERMAETVGFHEYIGHINERLESVRVQLETAKGDEVELLQARIKELKYCANIVKDEVENAKRARESMKEFVK